MWNRSKRHCSEQQIDRSGLLSFAAAQLAGSFDLDITVNAIAVAFAGPDLSAIQEKVAKAQKSRRGRVRNFVFATVVVGATAIAATIPDPKAFRSGRDFAAWIGLVPRQDSTGGKQKLGPISKQGDQYLRRILLVGAHAVLKLAHQQPEKWGHSGASRFLNPPLPLWAFAASAVWLAIGAFLIQVQGAWDVIPVHSGFATVSSKRTAVC